MDTFKHPCGSVALSLSVSRTRCLTISLISHARLTLRLAGLAHAQSAHAQSAHARSRPPANPPSGSYRTLCLISHMRRIPPSCSLMLSSRDSRPVVAPSRALPLLLSLLSLLSLTLGSRSAHALPPSRSYRTLCLISDISHAADLRLALSCSHRATRALTRLPLLLCSQMYSQPLMLSSPSSSQVQPCS
jgi:hypothetical protein